MMKIHKLAAIPLLFVFVATSIQGEEPSIAYDADYSTAYQESNQVALWSAYATITVFVVGAIYFGLTDGSDSSSGCYNGLGSMKRSCLKSSHSRRSCKHSKGSHSH